jgi:Tol biopolymer transport system component
VTTRVSVSSHEAQGNEGSFAPAISADGRYVAFDSYASNLVRGDTNGVGDVFVRDLATGTTARVSLNSHETQGNDHSDGPAISADGRHVAYVSIASNLAPGDTGGFWDVFVRDRSAGTTRQVSVSSHEVPGNDDSGGPAISANGRYVAFDTLASNLVKGDTNAAYDVFVRDLATGTTRRVSVDSHEVQGDAPSADPAISAGGRFVAFASDAHLVGGDTGEIGDVFVRDRATGTTHRVSVSSHEIQGNGHSGSPVISADGRYVAFSSAATNLVRGDTNGTVDLFVRDRLAGTTRRVSEVGFGPTVSADGRYVAFSSDASDLVPGDTNGFADVFLRGPAR